MDAELLAWIHFSWAHPALDTIMAGATVVAPALVPLVGLALLFSPRWRRVGVALLVAFAAALVLSVAFQALVARPRPPKLWRVLRAPAYFGFPSGHAAGAQFGQ